MDIPAIIDFKEAKYNEFINDISKNTFIFLGAGFSKQVGYKAGEELAQKVMDFVREFTCWSGPARVKP